MSQNHQYQLANISFFKVILFTIEKKNKKPLVILTKYKDFHGEKFKDSN